MEKLFLPNVLIYVISVDFCVGFTGHRYMYANVSLWEPLSSHQVILISPILITPSPVWLCDPGRRWPAGHSDPCLVGKHTRLINYSNQRRYKPLKQLGSCCSCQSFDLFTVSPLMGSGREVRESNGWTGSRVIRMHHRQKLLLMGINVK